MDGCEMGYEVIKVLRRPGRAGVVISARFTAEEADAIQRIAEMDDTTLTNVVRRAVLREAYQPIVRIKRIA